MYARKSIPPRHQYTIHLQMYVILSWGKFCAIEPVAFARIGAINFDVGPIVETERHRLNGNTATAKPT